MPDRLLHSIEDVERIFFCTRGSEREDQKCDADEQQGRRSNHVSLRAFGMELYLITDRHCEARENAEAGQWPS
jgi:hypothetical protein